MVDEIDSYRYISQDNQLDEDKVQEDLEARQKKKEIEKLRIQRMTQKKKGFSRAALYQDGSEEEDGDEDLNQGEINPQNGPDDS